MSYVNGKWSGLTVNGKRREIALRALREIASMGGPAAFRARQALKDVHAVKSGPKEAL